MRIVSHTVIQSYSHTVIQYDCELNVVCMEAITSVLTVFCHVNAELVCTLCWTAPPGGNSVP